MIVESGIVMVAECNLDHVVDVVLVGIGVGHRSPHPQRSPIARPDQTRKHVHVPLLSKAQPKRAARYHLCAHALYCSIGPLVPRQVGCTATVTKEVRQQFI